MIGKFGELSYHMRKNSTKWNSRAGARLRQQTFSLGAKCASPGGLLYDREVRRTFLSYKKKPDKHFYALSGFFFLNLLTLLCFMILAFRLFKEIHSRL